MSKALPMGSAVRLDAYLRTNHTRDLTPAQRRRIRHKNNHELAVIKKANA